MIKIIADRATGKTGQLMLLAKETDGVIVCADPVAQMRRAHAYGITGIDFVDYTSYIENKNKYAHRSVYIDELSTFLTRAFGQQIKGYTESNG